MDLLYSCNLGFVLSIAHFMVAERDCCSRISDDRENKIFDYITACLARNRLASSRRDFVNDSFSCFVEVRHIRYHIRYHIRFSTASMLSGGSDPFPEVSRRPLWYLCFLIIFLFVLSDEHYFP